MGLHTVVLAVMVWAERPRPAPEAASEARTRETRPVPSEEARTESPAVEVQQEEPEEREAEAAEEQAAAPPEQAQQGVDVPVRLEGAPFPYPQYLSNIILQIKRHWRPPSSRSQLRAELAFTIMRDGSVEDVVWVRRSGNWAFDLEARGAIEAAGRRGVFGPLPEDYPTDRLRVSFFFDPTRY
jgi:outer membrane biosynthesis protein TonB